MIQRNACFMNSALGATSSLLEKIGRARLLPNRSRARLGRSLALPGYPCVRAFRGPGIRMERRQHGLPGHLGQDEVPAAAGLLVEDELGFAGKGLGDRLPEESEIGEGRGI